LGTAGRRRFPGELKIRVLQELETGKSPAEICREHGVHPSTLSRWKGEQREDPARAFAGNGNIWKPEARIAELERLLGQAHAEIAFLKKVSESLQQMVREKRRAEGSFT